MAQYGHGEPRRATALDDAAGHCYARLEQELNDEAARIYATAGSRIRPSTVDDYTGRVMIGRAGLSGERRFLGVRH
jgi:hypothetical protein